MSNRMRYSATKQEALVLLCLILIQIGLVSWYVYQSWEKEPAEFPHKLEDTLVVGYLPGERSRAQLTPFGPGFEEELVELFLEEHDFSVSWKRMQDYEQGVRSLQQGRVHLFLSGPNPRAPEGAQVVKGPGYLENRFMVLHNKWRYSMRSLEDLCTTEVVFPDRFYYRDKRKDLEKNIQCILQSPKNTEPGAEFFKALSNPSFRFGITDKLRYKKWHGFHPEIRKSYTFEGNVRHNWMWTRDRPDLSLRFFHFWERGLTERDLEKLREKYYGFFPSEHDPYQISHFLSILQTNALKYRDTILEAARENDLDPLFLVALIYQESHFDPYATSRTGVRGLLQITTPTAEFLGIEDRLDPHESIRGGAKYLRFLAERLERVGVESWDKWFFALAAYNQGLGHAYDARELARRRDMNPDSWADGKETYPLLSYREYYQTVPRGYARGFEAVQFVDNVRYYYYLLHGLLALSRSEVEDFSGFLDFVPSNWPN